MFGIAPGDSDGEQVYVRDRQRRTTTRVSLTAEGEPFHTGVSGFDVSLSADGRYVAFTAEEGVFVRDRRRGVTERIATGAQPDLSANGRFVAFQSCADDVVPGDGNDGCDVFLRDRRRGTTRIVSVSGAFTSTPLITVVPTRAIAATAIWLRLSARRRPSSSSESCTRGSRDSKMTPVSRKTARMVASSGSGVSTCQPRGRRS